jgi:ABC-2 type transport system permease protein
MRPIGSEGAEEFISYFAERLDLMNRLLGTRWTVACWEFHRYVKLKDQIVGLISMLVGAGIGFGAVHLASSSTRINLAVIGETSPLKFPEGGRISRVDGDHSESEWRALVQTREIDGLLVVSESSEPAKSVGKPKLIVRQEPTWLRELMPVLQADQLQREILSAKIDPLTLNRLFAPAEIDIVALNDGNVSKADKVLAVVLLLATVMTSWMGLAYMLTGITGEKQQRVTEQIVSAIRPQMWIDGKLLGITAASICSLGFLLLSAVISLPAAHVFGFAIPWPGALSRIELIPLFIVFYVGGVLFWNCFYAGLTAAINDPQTSSRSALLFLPMLPMFAAAVASPKPDGAMMRSLSMLPGTSTTAMPMRLVLGEVMIWEIVASLALMVAGIACLRLVAGRIFAAGIMLYGKEPSLLDIANWTLGRTVMLNASNSN